MSNDAMEEEGTMKAQTGTFRTMVYLLVAATMVFMLAACGGGGGGSAGSTSPGVAGPATVSVSIASAPSYPAGTTFASSTATLSPATAAPPGNSPNFDNVWVTVTKLALIPSNGPEYPDADGEMEMPNSSAEEGKLVTGTLAPPIRIDLRHLSGDNVATLLNQFLGVPAGEYSKIRVYYDNVVGQEEGQPDKEFHPTAHYHFDVHFVGGNLVIPVTSDPGGGIRFYSVVINLVGLKYHQAGKSGNVLLRPQVFAKMVSAPEYIVTGVADKVNKSNLDGTFDILTSNGRTIPAAFYVTGTGTTWAYSDNVLQASLMVISRPASVAVPAFDNRAEVSAIGVFDASGRLQASHITFAFPDFRIGAIASTWSADNTYFRLDLPLPLDNLVYAIPDKRNPLYTNFRVPPVELANGYNLIVFPNPDNTVKARGYAITDSQGPGLRSFWISIDNNIVP